MLDRCWRIVLWNRTQAALLRDLHEPQGSPADLNGLELVFAPGPLRESLVNWDEVARAVLARLKRQLARIGTDDPLGDIAARIRSMPGVAELESKIDPAGASPILVPMRIREGDRVLTWFSTLAVFGATGDVTLDELVIESFFPGDETTRAFVVQLATSPD